MNCSKCNTPMEEGQLDRSLWVKKGLSRLLKLVIGKAIGSEARYTIAYRCPACKKIELYTEDVKELLK